MSFPPAEPCTLSAESSPPGNIDSMLVQFRRLQSMLEAVDCRFLFDLTISDTVSIVLMNGEQSRVPIFMLSCNIINHVTDYLQRHLSALPGHDFRLIYGSVDSSRSSTFSGGSESEAHRFESFEEMSAQLAFAITFSTLLAVIRTGNHTLCPPYGPRTGHSEIMKIEQSLCTGLRSEVAMPLLALAHAAAREQVEDRHLEDALYALTDRQCPWLWGAHDFLPLSVVLFSYNSANAQWPSYCDYHDAVTRLWDAVRIIRIGRLFLRPGMTATEREELSRLLSY